MGLHTDVEWFLLSKSRTSKEGVIRKVSILGEPTRLSTSGVVSFSDQRLELQIDVNYCNVRTIVQIQH